MARATGARGAVQAVLNHKSRNPPIRTDGGFRAPCGQKILEIGTDRPHRHPVRSDQPVRLITIPGPDETTTNGTTSTARSLDSPSPTTAQEHARPSRDLRAELQKLSP
jgi:hypothetical protein